MRDQRFVYGARCTWFGAIEEIGHTASGLPACPHCGSVLFEMKSEADWWESVDRYEAHGHPGYRQFVEWSRGKHFRSFSEAKVAYDAQTPRHN